jgi:hypothetical protein
MVEIEDDAAPGWDAIDAALRRIYPGVEPLHYGTVVKWMLGGPDPLDGISFYARPDHWHIVSYGMSELYGKESDDPDESGWGFEFTFRVARRPDETEPPVWAANFLQNLARYVFTSGNTFGPGHHMDLNGPISLAEPGTAIRAITFADDPELGVIDTPHGRLRFLQVVGLTLDEYAAAERWDAAKLVDALRPHLPLLVTDLGRAGLAGDPAVAAAVEEGVRRDGSSTGSLYVKEAGCEIAGSMTTLTFGANAAPRVGRVLAGRLPFGYGLIVSTNDAAIAFRPGDEFAVEPSDGGLVAVTLTDAQLPELIDALRPKAGTYAVASTPNLVVRIVKSQILDQDGTVVEEIG